MSKMFEPRPLPAFDLDKPQPRCLCGTPEEYEDFLIGEYGAEKVLEVKREEEQTRKMLEEMGDIDRFAMFAISLCGLGKGVIGDG